MIDQEVQVQDEITEIGEEQVTNVIEKQHEELVIQLKVEKRNAKSRMTRLLNYMATILADSNAELNENLLLRIDEQKDETLHAMDKLENIYRKSKDSVNAGKVIDEAEVLVDQVEKETSSVRIFLTSLRKKQWGSSLVVAISRDSEASQQTQEEDERRKNAEQWARLRKEAEIQQKKELFEEQERGIQASQEKANKTRQELDALDQGPIVTDVQQNGEQ